MECEPQLNWLSSQTTNKRTSSSADHHLRTPIITFVLLIAQSFSPHLLFNQQTIKAREMAEQEQSQSLSLGTD